MAESAAVAVGGGVANDGILEKHSPSSTRYNYELFDYDTVLYGPKENVEGVAIPRILQPTELGPDANALLLALVRFPVERFHPRSPRSGRTSSSSKMHSIVVSRITDSIPTLFQKLIQEDILSTPVVDDSGKYIGSVDYLDLVIHTMESFHVWHDKTVKRDFESLSEELRSAHLTQFWELAEFREKTVGDIMEKSTWAFHSGFQPVVDSTSLLFVMDMMVKSGAHRVPVVDAASNKIVNLITQSMAIHVLDQGMSRFGCLKDVPIPDVISPWSSTSTLTTIDTSATAMQAFQKMVKCGFTALPVVNKEGVLVDVISIRDLRGIGSTAGNFQMLYAPLTTFKDECRKVFSSKYPSCKAVYVTPNDTFGTVVRTMKDKSIHRVFVCAMDEHGLPKPVHVITQRDALRFLLHRLGLPAASAAAPRPV